MSEAGFHALEREALARLLGIVYLRGWLTEGQLVQVTKLDRLVIRELEDAGAATLDQDESVPPEWLNPQQLQLPLGAPGPAPAPTAPHQASSTSRAAAESIEPAITTLRGIVLAFLRTEAPGGATDEEMQLGLGMGPSTQRPRRIELVRGGLVRATGVQRQTSSGRMAEVWTAVRASAEGGGR